MAKKKSGGSVDFKVTASGLNKVDKDAKKAGKSFNQLDKNARSADRAGKGVANMSSNVTKNFSKMSQGITSGLVPAYATLAAQLFALDALFRFFREAADFRVLQQGQELFAASTGRAMRTLSKDIQAATSAQITFKEASQATAIGLSAGLSPTMLKELGEAARTVSVALGRDTTDSFNRLIRGVTKAEPELLDELGIILRLEEATTRYAASLGLNKNQLTTFQKSQAVANEVLRQAEERYGAINGMIGDESVNQLNKLMVAFDTVMNQIRLFVAPIAEFFGTFLTENIESATAAIALFASSMSKALIAGAMPQIDYGRAAQVAAQVTGSGDLQQTPQMSASRIKRLQEGTATEKDIAAYERATKAKSSSMLKFEKFSRREHQKTVAILKAQRQRMIADANVGFERMKMSFIADLYEMEAEHGKVMGRMKFAGVMFGKVMSGIMSAIGIIGVAVMIFQMGKQLMNMFRDIDERAEKIRKKIDGQTESLKSLTEEIGKTTDFFDKELFAGAEQRIKAIGGAFQSADFAARVLEAREALNRLGEEDESVQNQLLALRGLADELGTFNPEFKEFSRLLRDNPELALRSASGLISFAEAAVEGGQAVDNITRAQANFQKQFNKFEQAGKKIPFQDIVFALNELQKEQFKFAQTQGLSSEEARIANAEYEVTRTRLTAFVGLYEAAASQAMQFAVAQRQGVLGTTALFGDKENIQDALKVAGEVNKILTKRGELFALEVAILNMSEGINKQIQQQRLKVAQQELELQKDQLAMMLASQDKILLAFRNATSAFAKELGTTFGKLFRGESVDFKKFGESLTKVLTNSLGEALANRIMKITFRGTPLDPAVQKAKFKNEVEAMLMHQGKQMAENLGVAGQDASLNFFNALDTGGVSAADTIGNVMTRAANYHATKIAIAMGSSLDAQIDYDNLLIQKNKTRIEELRRQNKGGISSDLTDARNALTDAYGMGFGDIIYGTRKVTGAPTRANPYGETGDTDFFNTLKEMFPGRTLRNLDGSGISGVTDHRIQLATSMAQSLSQARAGVQNMDIKSLQEAEASYNDFMTKSLETKLMDSDDPFIQNFMKFFQELPALIHELEKADNAEANRANIIEKNSREIEDLTRQNKTLEAAVETNTNVRDGVTTTTSSGQPSDPQTTFDANGNPITVTPTPAFDDEVKTFQDMSKELYGNLFDVMEGSDSGVANFARGSLHFATAVTQFGGLISQGLALAGKQEEAADIMLEVAKIQMALAIADMAVTAGKSLAAFFRYGGMTPGGRYGAQTGGVFDGPESGYNVKMHGNEAVVPLGNDRAIPVKMTGSGGTNNVNVTVNVANDGATDTSVTADGGAALGKTIAAIATETIVKEQRAGGLLSRI